MNLENIVDWSPAWTFTDAFQASRGWITHGVNTATGQTTWDVGQTNPVAVDSDGNVTSPATFTNAAGRTIRQQAGTLMFREVNGAYPAGTHRAEWEGTGRVTCGFDARVASSGRTAAGINHADLAVTPGNGGISLRIEETSPADPVRNFHVWMPDWQGRSFAGQRWQPGASFSPFHPLFRERLAPFGVIRFMMTQETNTSDIRTWADRRDARDIRQSSGLGGSRSDPVAKGRVVFEAGQTRRVVTVRVLGDRVAEADETFTLRLTDAQGARPATPAGTGMITNDDPAPRPTPTPNPARSRDQRVAGRTTREPVRVFRGRNALTAAADGRAHPGFRPRS